MIDINTRFITLIGTHLGQSFAARMHNTGYEAAGFNMYYMYYFYCEVDETHLAEIIGGIRYMPSFAGCAGRAICSVLAYNGPAKIYVTDLFPVSSQSLVEDINQNFAPIAKLVDHGDFSAIASCDVVINASGVGFGGTIGQTPLPAEYILSYQLYFDAAYNPEKTQFLLNAEAKGCRILNGLGMSLYQGVAQIELWTGKPAPVEAMRKELMAILAE